MAYVDPSWKIPSSSSLKSREERLEVGKSLRADHPRASHAVLKAAENRRDSLNLLVEFSKGLLTQLIPIKYGRMMQSPFTFYRGAAAIMAADLARTPTSGITVQCCGDCHLVNFGGFATPERRIIFDINDFDETLPGPWEWDIKRLATSFVIAGRDNKFTPSGSRKAALRCVQSYREHMHTYSKMSALDVWYDRIDAKALLQTLQSDKWGKVKKRLQDRISEESSRTVEESDFPKLATIEAGNVRIKDNRPLIYHHALLDDLKYRQAVIDATNQYRNTLTDGHNALLDHYEIKDIAVKVVGIGSIGTFCAIALLMSPDNDVLFLQIKEARASVLESYLSKSLYSSHGQRVVAGQKLMQSASDIFLGWTKGPKRDFYIRQLRDIKIKAPVEQFDEPAMTKYAEWCGWALARAHAKSGDSAVIHGYLGNSNEFDEAIASFAVTYADQNERDYKDFLKAIRAGKIEVDKEV